MTRTALLVGILSVCLPPLAAAPVPKSLKNELIRFLQPAKCGGISEVVVIKPDGTEVARFGGFEVDYQPFIPRLSPDRKRLAVSVTQPLADPTDKRPGFPFEVRVYEVAKPHKPPTVVASGLRQLSHAWGADSDSLFVSHWVPNIGRGWRGEVRVFDLTSDLDRPVELPANHRLADVSPDGRTLLVNAGTERDSATFLADAGTLQLVRLTRHPARGERFSPDGTKVLGLKFLDPKSWHSGTPFVFDLKADSETEVELGDDTISNPAVVWSGDGRNLLVGRSVAVDPDNPFTRTVPERALRDPDGANPKPFLWKKYPGAYAFDWR